MRKRGGDIRDQQLLLRVTRSEFEILDAAAHLKRMTPNAYVYELVQTHVEALRTNEFVMRDVENRQAFEAAMADSKTVSLAGERRRIGRNDQHDRRAARDEDA